MNHTKSQSNTLKSTRDGLNQRRVFICVNGGSDSKNDYVVVVPDGGKPAQLTDSLISEIQSATNEFWSLTSCKHAREILNQQHSQHSLHSKIFPYIGLGHFRSDIDILETANFEASDTEAISSDWEKVGATLCLSINSERRKLTNER